MTIPEAARLVLQAGAIGESGQVQVLDMGDPVRIVDLAKTMIRMAGREEQEIGIRFTGLRPGEKLYEELLSDDDTSVPTRIRRLRIARLGNREGADEVNLGAWLNEMASAEGWQRDAVVDGLLRLVPEYRRELKADLALPSPMLDARADDLFS